LLLLIIVDCSVLVIFNFIFGTCTILVVALSIKCVKFMQAGE
jgi:hypothetical protein